MRGSFEDVTSMDEQANEAQHGCFPKVSDPGSGGCIPCGFPENHPTSNPNFEKHPHVYVCVYLLRIVATPERPLPQALRAEKSGVSPAPAPKADGGSWLAAPLLRKPKEPLRGWGPEKARHTQSKATILVVSFLFACFPFFGGKKSTEREREREGEGERERELGSGWCVCVCVRVCVFVCVCVSAGKEGAVVDGKDVRHMILFFVQPVS